MSLIFPIKPASLGIFPSSAMATKWQYTFSSCPDQNLVLALTLHFFTFYIQSIASQNALPIKYIQNLTSSHYLHCSTSVQAIVICHLNYSSSFLTGLFILALHPPQQSPSSSQGELGKNIRGLPWWSRAKTLCFQDRGPGVSSCSGSITHAATRSKMPSAATKTWRSQMNK